MCSAMFFYRNSAENRSEINDLCRQRIRLRKKAAKDIGLEIKMIILAKFRHHMVFSTKNVSFLHVPALPFALHHIAYSAHLHQTIL